MAEPNGNRGRRWFIIAFIIFVSAVILLVIDMASRTTAPWNKPKSEAHPADTLLPDSVPGDPVSGDPVPQD